MAFTVTARGTGTVGSSATMSASPASDCNTGAWLVLVVAYDNSAALGADPYSPSSISDSAGNAWTNRIARLRDPGAANAGTTLRIFTTQQGAAPLTTGDSITLNFSVTVPIKVWALYELAADGTISYVGGTGGTGASATPTITTSSIPVGDLVIAACGREYNGTRTADADTTNGTWATPQSVGSGVTAAGQELIVEAKVQATSDSTQTFNPTFGGVSADYCLGWTQFHETPRAATWPGWVGGGWT